MIRLGTRGSALALAQARWVADRLPGEVELVPITTSGDEPSQRGQTPLGASAAGPSAAASPADPADPADKARFVKEIEDAVLAGDVDLAVHSAKDVPAEVPDGLAIVAVPERADARDALCGAEGLDSLPQGAVVGTASLRRRAALLALRPDLDVRDLRGNVDTRLGRLAGGDFDAILLAQAGLARLGRGAEGSPLDAGQFVPAAGQGCLIIEAREGDVAAAEAAARLTDRDSLARLTAERALVKALDATCDTPVGAHAVTAEARLSLTAFLGMPDGSHWIRDRLDGDAQDPAALGEAVAARMLSSGAAKLLMELSVATP